MTLSKQEMMKKTVQFMRALVDETLTSQAAEEMKALVHNYRRDLEAFNDDASLTYTRPFLLMVGDASAPLPEETIDAILRIAADNDLQDEFWKLTSAGQIFCLCSHKALALVKEIAKHMLIGFGNINANGIAIDGYHFLGFYSASAERIKAGLLEAELYLQSHA
ncbi:hypothetical protein LJR071_003223 [Pseudomonas sp. LjRoot71]|uniref:hypothetical protein n=1 Tax=Pseudomonas sp. LjRoot71 TaxID=3342336 RepID=UPI003ECE9C5F